MNRQRSFFTPQKLRYYSPVLVTLIAIIVLVFIPTGFENKLIYQGTERVAAKVLSVDNSMIIDTGLVRSGDQNCDIEFLDGQFKGQQYTAVNMLTGSLEIDKMFQPGDTAYVRISHRDGEILSVSMTDHYRLPWEILLVAIFIAVLIFFAGQTGLRAVRFPDNFRHSDNFSAVRDHRFAGVRFRPPGTFLLAWNNHRTCIYGSPRSCIHEAHEHSRRGDVRFGKPAVQRISGP